MGGSAEGAQPKEAGGPQLKPLERQPRECGRPWLRARGQAPCDNGLVFRKDGDRVRVELQEALHPAGSPGTLLAAQGPSSKELRAAEEKAWRGRGGGLGSRLWQRLGILKARIEWRRKMVPAWALAWPAEDVEEGMSLPGPKRGTGTSGSVVVTFPRWLQVLASTLPF